MLTNDYYNSTIAISRNFMKNEILPRAATMQLSKLERSTPTKSYNGITIFCVKSGNGKLVVNKRFYDLQAGTLVFLQFYHFFKLIPSNGENMEVYEMHAPNATYKFANMIPGASLESLESYLPITCLLSQQDRQNVFEVCGIMCLCDCLELQNIYLYELLGYISRSIEESANSEIT